MSHEQAKVETVVCHRPVTLGRFAAGRWLATRPLLAVGRWLAVGWSYARAVSGDDAYERYVAHRMAAHADQPLMTRKAFFAERQRQKWMNVARCC